MAFQYEINFQRQDESTSNNNTSNSNTETKKRRGSQTSSKPNKKPKPGSRKDNSLNRLTARFMSIIYSSENGTVDLNNASIVLQVQKRRIYDITNVLEGVGLIEKKSKNNIVWSGNFGSSDYQEQVLQLRQELSHLREEDRALDQKLKESQFESKQILQLKPESAFVTYDDIRSLPGMEDQTIIAVRAQTGTRLEVPDPDFGNGTGRKYQIYLKSEHPIDMHLVSPEEEHNNLSNVNVNGGNLDPFPPPPQQFAEPSLPIAQPQLLPQQPTSAPPNSQSYGPNANKYAQAPPGFTQSQPYIPFGSQFEMPHLGVGIGLGLDGADYFIGNDVGSISEFYDDEV